MPFGALHIPSIALTQLKSILEKQLKNKVSVEILYINQDFAKYLGTHLYRYLVYKFQDKGLGDWMFRQVAFPELSDNAVEYFEHSFPHNDIHVRKFRNAILEKREGIGDFLDQLIAKYKLDQADIVGFTSMFMQNVASFAMAQKLKDKDPGIINVIGGANCESPMGLEIVKHIRPIDFVFSGSALKSFPTFIQHCINCSNEELHTINGVFSKQNVTANGAIKPTGDELDIDVPINLDYDSFLQLLKTNFPDEKITPIILFATSRGCWWGRCSFCGLNGATNKYCAMSAETALDQFDSLMKYYPECDYFFSIDNVIPSNYFDDVLPFINPPANAKILYEVRANLKKHHFESMSKGNIKVIQPGIESLSTPVLKLMRKGTTAFQNITLLKNCLQYNIYPIWNLIMGFPGEDDSIYEKYCHDIPLFMHLPPAAGFARVRFDRYSLYHSEAEKYNLDLQPNDYYTMIYPFTNDVLTNLAYYFDDKNTEASYVQVVTAYFEKVEKVFKVWWNTWHDNKDKIHPKLFLQTNGKSVICDTRSGALQKYPVDPVHLQLLDHLNTPMRMEKIKLQMSHVKDYSIVTEMEYLKEKGLIFEENGRYMNLVLPSEPAVLENPTASI